MKLKEHLANSRAKFTDERAKFHSVKTYFVYRKLCFSALELVFTDENVKTNTRN